MDRQIKIGRQIKKKRQKDRKQIDRQKIDRQIENRQIENRQIENRQIYKTETMIKSLENFETKNIYYRDR